MKYLVLMTVFITGCMTRPQQAGPQPRTKAMAEFVSIVFDATRHNRAGRKEGWGAAIDIKVMRGKMAASLSQTSEVFWSSTSGNDDIIEAIEEYAVANEGSRKRSTTPGVRAMRTQYSVRYPDGTTIRGIGTYRRLSELPARLRELYLEAAAHATAYLASKRKR